MTLWLKMLNYLITKPFPFKLDHTSYNDDYNEIIRNHLELDVI